MQLETTAKEETKTQNEVLEKALVAGGAGFLGSALCRALIEQGKQVYCVDNLRTGSRENIEDLLVSSRFTFWQEDISTKAIKSQEKLDYVFHVASVEEYSTDKSGLETMLAESFGTKNLLDLAQSQKAKFIYVSSADIHRGALPQNSLEEFLQQDTDLAAISFSEGKRFAEILIAQFVRRNFLPTCILRVKDPYGPGMSMEGRSIIGELLGQAFKNHKIEIKGDGLRTTNPLFIDDIVLGILKAVQVGGKGEIYQLANPDKYTEKAVAEQIKRSLGEVEIDYKKTKNILEGEYPLVLEKTQQELGWQPKTSLDEGLEKTIQHFKKKAEAPAPLPTEVEKPKEERSGWSLPSFRFHQEWLKLAAGAGTAVLVLGLLVLPIVKFGVETSWGLKNLETSFENLKQNNLANGKELAEKALENYLGAENTFKQAGLVRELPVIKNQFQEGRDMVLFGQILSNAAAKTADALKDVETAAEPSVSAEETKAHLSSAKQKLEEVNNYLEITSTIRVEETALSGNLKGSYQIFQEIEGYLSEVSEKTINELEQLTD